MQLTITTTHRPATDLGFLLHKHPDRLQTFPQSFGQAHIFYTEASARKCTAVLLLDVDPIGLTRRGRRESMFGLDQYVNDRPYVASSFMSTAISDALGSALNGNSRERQELADVALPLEATVGTVRCNGGENLLRRLFEPLGYSVAATEFPLDTKFPEWGPSRYFKLTLTATVRLKELLNHLYVLLPVLDNAKHYWIGPDEVDKLMRKGQGWLAAHPERELISKRYLKYRRNLIRDAMERLREEDEPADSDEEEPADEPAIEKPIRLHQLRLDIVTEVLESQGAKRILDLGCGSGQLLERLIEKSQFTEIVGVDVSHIALEVAKSRLRLDRRSERQVSRLTLSHGSLTYRDRRLEGYDAAVASEVIEHLDEFRLEAFRRSIFEFMRPRVIILTTPNIEYNILFETLAAGKLRHGDHRFEWTRTEFQTWASAAAQEHGYAVECSGIGPADEKFGAPSQMAVFQLDAPS
jgi:3' terminal RNA ribose 2'-O-methyltransferase Hen1